MVLIATSTEMGFALDSATFTGKTYTYAPNNTNTGSYEEIVLPAGKYKMECYGSKSYDGVKGGYSCGIYDSNQDTTVFLYCGGNRSGSLGYNGGGKGAGGATHIALKSGLLKTRKSDYKDTVLLVAGGAGYGGEGTGGGESGAQGDGNGQSAGSMWNYSGVGISLPVAKPGTQTCGGEGSNSSGEDGSFGLGGSGNDCGGGGGLYGGGGGSTASTGRWVRFGSESNYVGASVTTHGAGGSGFINEKFIKEGSMKNGESSTSGKIVLTNINYKIMYHSKYGRTPDTMYFEEKYTLDNRALPTLNEPGYIFEGWWNEDYSKEYKLGEVINKSVSVYAKWEKANKLIVPKSILSGSKFEVKSENKYRIDGVQIDKISYQLVSNGTVVSNAIANVYRSEGDGNIAIDYCSKELFASSSAIGQSKINMIVYYEDGSRAEYSKNINIMSCKSNYSEGIRYIGNGYLPSEKSKWTSDSKLKKLLSDSVSKTVPEDTRVLK